MKENIKEQKLSPMRYIRNNKRRVSVLVISLSLCLAIIYVANFLVMSTDATARRLFLDSMENKCVIGFSFVDDDFTEEQINELDTLSDKEYSKKYIEFVNDKYREYAKMLEGEDNIVKAIPIRNLLISVKPPIGMLGSNIALVESEYADILLKHNDAKLIEGKLPEKPNEIVLDKATMLNNDFKIGDKCNERYTITGILECDLYYGYGIIDDRMYTGLQILSKKRIDDARTLLPLIGREYDSEYNFVDDYNTENKWFVEDITIQFEQATKYLYLGIFILLFVSLFVVYTTYLRDRHNEWCLYCSIGYSRKAIYCSIICELLFTFITAVLIGIIIAFGLVLSLDAIMMKPNGIACQYLYPDKIIEIICAFVLFFGLLQIPIRYALYKIRTIDAMEDDIY